MLDDIPLFAGLQTDELEHLSSKAVTHTYPKNTIVINEGDISNSLYVIIEGQVKIFRANEEGREIVLNLQGPGEYFGEIALLDSEPRSVSVITLEKCRIAILSKADFEAFLLVNPPVMMTILCNAIARLRALTDTVSNLALLDVYGRVTRLLLQSAEEIDGIRTVNMALTQQDIASRVGSSREMVSRILKDLRTGGYIEQQDRQILIRKSLPHAW
jgi:CRP/FNR family cyclic AMP-dependent transcriptional regulator